MATDDATPTLPGPPVPGGTRWLKVTSPHPGQVIKVKKSNGLSVFYVQERPGSSQGRNTGTHRSGYTDFLRDFQPLSKHDWNLAHKVMATLETPASATAEARAAPEVAPEPSNGQVESVATQADIETWGDGEAPSEEAPQIEEVAHARRMRPVEFSEAEQDEIVELWRARSRGDERVGEISDIAQTYNATTQAIYAVVSERVPDEYLLQRIVDQLKRHEGPMPAFRISQWMHLSKAQVAEICTSTAARKVLRYTVETNDVNRPWIKTPMIELLPVEPTAEVSVEPTPIPTTPQEPVVPTAAPTPVSETVYQYVAPTRSSTSTARQFRWKVSVRTTIEETVEAADIASAVATVTAKYENRPAQIVGVVIEET
jgi:hypothetical protein